ncbi:putative toxin-antitoxin system toxin component, PIN family [Methylomonas sp. BW4-1]|uniref:putative toxin-antitoxin system toxin component, PIN family n=1 Tax=Methylomonas sp. BW4-1 TaxID=3376685 RepID=UPI0040438C61
MFEIVLDTNVLFAGLYSANGASFKLLELLAGGQLQTTISTPLLFEYEDVLKRNRSMLQLTDAEVDIVLDNLCAFSRHQKVYFLWRPYLPDPKDDLVLELAVAARVNAIVTHNLKDFARIEKFGVEAITPKTLLERLP